MSISYPLTLPSTIGIERFALTSFNAVGLLRSPFTFATQTQEHQGQLWAAEVSVGLAVARSKAEPWIAFLTALMGPKGTFLMGDPLGKTARGTVAGTPLCQANGQTGNTLSTKGWSFSSAVLRAGDYIQIGQRLYKVLVDATSDGLGNVNIEIWPRLREASVIDTPIITSNCVGLFRLADSEVRLNEIDRELVYSISFSAVEAI
jgi:hypothetical protein